MARAMFNSQSDYGELTPLDQQFGTPLSTSYLGTGVVLGPTGDFNGDGILDQTICGEWSNHTLSVLLGNGDGTFHEATRRSRFPAILRMSRQPTSTTTASSIWSPPIEVRQLSVLLGIGDGTFTSVTTLSVGTGEYPFGVTAGDFNADGVADVAVSNVIGNNVSVFLGNADGSGHGNGTFQSAVNVPAGNFPASVEAADFDGDGKLDLVVPIRAPGIGVDPVRQRQWHVCVPGDDAGRRQYV